MSKQIAVLLDEKGQTTTLYESGFVKVYEKEEGQWKITKEVNMNVDQAKGIKSIRESISAMAEALNPCKIFAGKEVSGLAFTVLDMARFKVIEVEGTPEEFLDDVIDKLEQNELSKLFAENKTIEPKPLNKEGSYYLNLKELQDTKSGVTSKQALQPFLRNKTFYELQVVCSHIPPWIENELKSLKLESSTEKLDTNEYKLTIYHKTCD